MTNPAAPINAILENLQRQMNIVRQDLLNTRRKVYAMEAQGVLREQGRAPRMPLEFTAQYGEDLLAWDLFDRKLDGFFIEAGAFDGYRYSVTYGLEAVGWSGLLVEPIPQRVEECRKRRPHSHVVHAALSKRGASGHAEFNVTQDTYGGMLSYHKPTPEHVQSLGSMPRQTVSVPLTTLDDLLASHAERVDLAVIDVEGAEPDVLDGFNLSRYAPRVLIIEDNLLGRNPPLDAALAGQEYELIAWLDVNRVYVHRMETEMLERARWLLA